MTKKGTKTIPSRTEGPISDMDYHVIGTWPEGKPLPEIHPPWLEPKPERDHHGAGAVFACFTCNGCLGRQRQAPRPGILVERCFECFGCFLSLEGQRQAPRLELLL